jgi:NitT/TauT family transport system permease protein
MFAVVLAIPVAFLLHYFRATRKIVYPYVVFLQLTPAIVMAPIFIIWFGFGLMSKIMVAALTGFFVILVSALTGFDSVGTGHVDLLRSMVASRRQIFHLVTVRSALPHIFAGLKTGITLALIGALVAEFIASKAGLGMLLTQFSFSLRQSLVFATVVIVALVGATLLGALSLLERKIVWWER